MKCQNCGKELFGKSYNDANIPFLRNRCCYDCYAKEVGDTEIEQKNPKWLRRLKVIIGFLYPLFTVYYCYSKLQQGMPEAELESLLVKINIPYVIFYFSVVFVNSTELFNSIKYIIIPDIFSFFKGESAKDRHWSILFLGPIAITAIIGMLELITITLLFDKFK